MALRTQRNAARKQNKKLNKLVQQHGAENVKNMLIEKYGNLPKADQTQLQTKPSLLPYCISRICNQDGPGDKLWRILDTNIIRYSQKLARDAQFGGQRPRRPEEVV